MRGLLVFLLVIGSTGRLAGQEAARIVIASKRSRDLRIVLTSEASKLTAGKNGLCVAFRKNETNAAIDVKNVAAEFSLLVGRIQEEAVRAQLRPKGLGRYCGSINLGAPRYSPASYYVFVSYLDSTGKKRKERLFVTVK